MHYIIWFFIFASFGAKAQDAVAVVNTFELTNLASQAQFVRDENGRLSIQDILQNKGGFAFRPVEKDVISFGVTSDVFWIKSTLKNNTRKELFLKIGNNALTALDVFETTGDTLVKHHHSGSRLPFSRREVNDVDFLFPLLVQPGEMTIIYVRVQHSRGTHFSLLAGTETAFYNEAGQRNLLQGIYYGFMLLMILYNLFIYFSLKDSSYLYYVLYVFLMGLFNASIAGYAFQYFWPSAPALNQYEDILSAAVCIAGILFTIKFLETKRNVPVFHRILIGLLVMYLVIMGMVAAGFFLLSSMALAFLTLALVLFFFATAYAVLRKGYKPARFFLIAWSLLLLSVVVFVLKEYTILPYTTFTANSVQIGSAVEALLLSMALANRINVYKQEKQAAQFETLRSLEENRKLITEQNQVLEKKVEERTVELKRANKELLTALMNLKETQTQLIQREKMASLGELIAGIAHEIQNPLNFVNNFSETNTELLAELKSEALAGHTEEVVSLADEAINNEQRINHHGKRADSIVKSMLQHAGSGAGKKEPANINALTDEYLRMSYHGLRAKDNTFNVKLETDYDQSIGEIPVASQELGRVLLNLYNNAFYTVNEKKKGLNGYFEPTVSVSTKKTGKGIEIVIRDNGTGIPPKVLDKIYQPFFTTKPTGIGTGLGLSLSYDIITKGHNGELNVQTKEGEGTEFKIILPADSI